VQWWLELGLTEISPPWQTVIGPNAVFPKKNGFTPAGAPVHALSVHRHRATLPSTTIAADDGLDIWLPSQQHPSAPDPM
jgi:hypothetical protein